MHYGRFRVFTHVLSADQSDRLWVLFVKVNDRNRTRPSQILPNGPFLLPVDYLQPADTWKLHPLTHLKGNIDRFQGRLQTLSALVFRQPGPLLDLGYYRCFG